MEEKILTREEVIKLGLDKVQVITADMLAGYTNIGNFAFNYCFSLISVDIPDNVTRIGGMAFYKCTSLTSIIIPNSVTNIGSGAFACCSSLASIEIPNSVTYIGGGIFNECNNLTSIVIYNKEYKKYEIINGKCKAYKGFKANMTCRDFRYEEGKTYKFEGEPILCKQGFHACLSLSDVFTYYYGIIGKDIVVHEVKLDDISVERHIDSKVVAKKITIGKRIL